MHDFSSLWPAVFPAVNLSSIAKMYTLNMDCFSIKFFKYRCYSYKHYWHLSFCIRFSGHYVAHGQPDDVKQSLFGSFSR